AGVLHGSVLQSVPESVRPIVSLSASIGNQAGAFDRPGWLRGAMPLSGYTKICLFFGCQAAPLANLTLPMSVIGRHATATLAVPVNLTVQGAPWTTGYFWTQYGVETVAGSSMALPDGGLQLGLVTPIYISTNLPAIAEVPSWAKLALQLAPASNPPAC